MVTPAPPPEVPPPLGEAETRELSVTIHSVEGLNFLTELGNQQIASSILFPTHLNDSLSPLCPPSPKISFEFTEKFQLTVHPLTTVNALLANPLEFYLYVATADFKKQTQVARFVLSFDDLLFNQSYSASVDGVVLNDGQSILQSEGLKASIECSWSKPLFESNVSHESMIATFSISSVTALPQCLVNCLAQPNNFSTHIFGYSLFTQLPDGQIISIDDGKFASSSADGSDAAIQFSNTQKFFIGPESFQKWKAAAESSQMSGFFLLPELLPPYQGLGLSVDSYEALYARADLPLAHFAKPGSLHFLSPIPFTRDAAWAHTEHPIPIVAPNGFPPEVPNDAASKKRGPARRTNLSSRESSKGGKQPPTATAKKAKALSAKDKKLLQQIQSVLNNLNETDYFKESTTQLKIEIVLSKPLIPRISTPVITKKPEEVIRPLPKFHDQRLANATEEFCRQLNAAVDKLTEAYKAGVPFDNYKQTVKEQLKPSIVGIVSQVFQGKPPNSASFDQTYIKAPKPPEAAPPADTPKKSEELDETNSQSFLSELRSFLMVHLNKSLNSRFSLSFPRSPLIQPLRTAPQITSRISLQKFHKTDDLRDLYLQRCELEPLNPQYPYELAIYLLDQGSADCLEYFARAISIDYTFKNAILGFCAFLSKTGDKENSLVLLNMLYQKNGSDPTLVVCLSILYSLMESSKSDEFQAKLSQMAQQLPKSPYLIAASSLLDVHDVFLSEIALSKEQVQAGRSKDLLILLARFSQQSGEFSRAQEYAKEALELDREDQTVWKMLGDFQFRSGDREKARTSYQTLLSLSEEPDPEACLVLSILNLSISNYQMAYDLLMFTVQKMPNCLAWTLLGVCCFRMGNYKEAEASFEQANELDNWYPTTWGYCSLLCAKQGKFVEGMQCVRYALKLELRDWKVIQEIVEAYKGQNGEEITLALDEFRKINKEECHESLESIVTEIQQDEAPKAELPKAEAPTVEPSKAEAQKVEPPKAESAKQ